MLVSHEVEDRLARSAGGDEDAFAGLVREHQGMVFSIGCHFLRDATLAEELAQEVFLHLYRNLRSIESPSHLVYWLRKVTTHRCIDQARRARLRPRVGLDQAPEPRTGPDGRDPLLTGHYLIELTRTGALDDLLVRVEARTVLEGEGSASSADELARRLKGMCGLSATIEIALPGAVERSMGKARRVIDKR